MPLQIVVCAQVVYMLGDVCVYDDRHSPVGRCDWIGALICCEVRVHEGLYKSLVGGLCFLDECNGYVVLPHVML